MVKKDELKEKFTERLRAACLEAGVGGRGLPKRMKDALAKQGISITEPGIWKWMNAAAIPDSVNILALSRWLHVRPEWLEYGRGEMKENVPGKSIPDANIPPEEEWDNVDAWDSSTPLPTDEVEVPFLRDIELAAGDGSYNEEDYNGFKLRFSKATLRRIGARTDGTGVLCFPARGNSMEPNIPDGSTVAVNTDDKQIVDGKIYAINQDGWKRLKILYRVGPNRISIRSFNDVEHPAEEVDLDKIEVIGRLFWTSTIW
ncbi:S24 family peptidase [Serratia marcescens]|uniref:S24 family peptidase n=1 Tax=Serratia marcescens TaxID=615 RepID=UPI00188307E1|nr:helix-turn-helix transcriptional regulator [Serratia marcescens]MBE8812233.1 phage repressor protein C [Serratia marcescens]